MYFLHGLEIREQGQAPVLQGQDVWVDRSLSMYFLQGLDVREHGQAPILQGEDVWVDRHITTEFLHSGSTISMCLRSGLEKLCTVRGALVLRNKEQKPA